MNEPIVWFRQQDGDINYPNTTYTARVLNTYYRVEREEQQTDGCNWFLWIKDHGDQDFSLWGGFSSLKQAKQEVFEIASRESV